MIAIATWKFWVVSLIVVIGVIGMLLRGLIDMLNNWETGYGSDSRKATKQALSWFGVCIVVAILVGLFGCTVISSNRVFPKVVPAWSDEAKQERAYRSK